MVSTPTATPPSHHRLTDSFQYILTNALYLLPHMVSQIQEQQPQPTCLIVGNYCHDVLIKDDIVLAESLGGATAFISAVLDGLSVPSHYICKVGPDFSYSVNHLPIQVPSTKTTLFHAHFSSRIKRQDRILKRVRACDPIFPSDLPIDSKFSFGLAVGVAGEIIPETLEKMANLCNLVFVDVQALIRVFDPVDGTVRLVGLKETGFFRLLPRIGVLKASAEEAPYVDVEEARKWCCVLVTNGKDGCSVYWKDGEMQISAFTTIEVDPTGAGDSFLGGFVAGLVNGLNVHDSALLGNFFGSVTVGHLGFPKLESMMLQRVKDEVEKRRLHYLYRAETENQDDDVLEFNSPLEHHQHEFHAALDAARLIPPNPTTQQGWPWAVPVQIPPNPRVKDEVEKRRLHYLYRAETENQDDDVLKFNSPLEHHHHHHQHEFHAALDATRLIPPNPTTQEWPWAVQIPSNPVE